MLIVDGRAAADGTFDACAHAIGEAFALEARRDDEQLERVLAGTHGGPDGDSSA